MDAVKSIGKVRPLAVRTGATRLFYRRSCLSSCRGSLARNLESGRCTGSRHAPGRRKAQM